MIQMQSSGINWPHTLTYCHQPLHLINGIFRGGKASMLTHIYPHKPLRKVKVAFAIIKVDSPFYLWPGVYSGELQAYKL